MSYQSEHLYIRDSKGKERVWSVSTRGSEITVKYGLIKGKITEKVTAAKPKNMGKSNETTAEQQAILEAKAKFTKQVDREDYNVDIDKAGLQFRPMLALDYLKVPHRVDWGDALVQPKLDGLRLAAGFRYENGGIFELMTRKGENYNIPHFLLPLSALWEQIEENLPEEYTCRVIDGEAYIHGWSLQNIISAAKKYRSETTDKLEYHIFDLCIPGMPFYERMDILTESYDQCVEMGDLDPNFFRIVKESSIDNEEQLIKMQNTYLEQGFEGVMIRHATSQYSIGQRSPDLFKFKQFFDMECVIIDVWEDNNGNAMLTCVIPEGGKFNCTPKRTHEVRAEMLNNKDYYIGKWLTVKYQALTDGGLPQFPVGLDIRDCDEAGAPLL